MFFNLRKKGKGGEGSLGRRGKKKEKRGGGDFSFFLFLPLPSLDLFLLLFLRRAFPNDICGTGLAKNRERNYLAHLAVKKLPVLNIPTKNVFIVSIFDQKKTENNS